jgi:transcriptional regulator with XRE-family HTH domain
LIPVAMERNTTEMFFKEFGTKITSFRKELNLTQEQLAQKIGVSQQIIALYELGKRRIPISLLVPIAKSLHVNIEDLLGIEKKGNKRGPIPKIQKRLEQIQTLPLDKQKMVLEVLDTIMQGAIQQKTS